MRFTEENRDDAMYRNLEGTEEYSPEHNTLTVNYYPFNILNQNISLNPNNAFISIGMTPRELISVKSNLFEGNDSDLTEEESEYLRIIRENFINQCKRLENPSLEDILKLINVLISGIFYNNDIETFLKKPEFNDYPHIYIKQFNTRLPVIPLAKFIYAGVGVCRHGSLLASMLLLTAIDNNLIANGQVSLFRTKVWTQKGEIAHSFAIYKSCQSELYIVDPMLKNITLLNQEVISSCNGIPFYGNEVVQQLLDTYGIPYTLPLSEDLSDTLRYEDELTQPYSFDDGNEQSSNNPNQLFGRSYSAPAALESSKINDDFGFSKL